MDENRKMDHTDIIIAKGILSIEAFTDMVKDALPSHVKGCTFEVEEVRKNNGVVCHGIRIKEPGSNIAPVIYLDDAFKDYKNGRDFHEIVTAVVEYYRQNRPIVDFDSAAFTDYERVKERICLKIVNTVLNRELLSGVPHIPFHDLSAVFYVPIDSIPGQNASILVNNGHMADWGVDVDMLFETAKANTQSILGEIVAPMNNFIEGLLDGRTEDRLPEPEGCCMYVATNRKKLNGAAVILYDSLLAGFADRIGNDFYIIPSSIHELIFIPGSMDIGPSEMREMVSEVNSACVDPEEVLSNNVYRYCRETGLVEVA